jgi:hypothetical protein
MIDAPSPAKLEFFELGPNDDTGLRAFYEVYKDAFPHPDEREPFESFVNVLKMNADADLQKRFGPYHEFVLAVRDEQSHETVGGLVPTIADE